MDYQENVQLLASVPLSESVDLAQIGSRVFVAGGAAGIYVLDVTDPSQPSIETTMPPPASREIRALVASGNHLYAATSSPSPSQETLAVIDGTSSPPQLLGTVALGTENVTDLAVSGNLVLAACGADGLYIVDVSSPPTPLVVATHDPVTSTSVSASAVTASGSFAFYSWVGGGADIGTQILDISSPASPTVVGTVPGGPHADLSASATDLFTLSYQYASSQADTVGCFDITSPSSPVLRSESRVATASAVVATGGLGLTAGWMTSQPAVGENVVLDPAAPGAGVAGRLRPFGGRDVLYSPPYAYVATEPGGVDVLEVLGTQTVEPAAENVLRLPNGLNPAEVGDLVVLGATAILSSVELVGADSSGGIYWYATHVLDASDPLNLVETDRVYSNFGSLPPGNGPLRLDAAGGLAVQVQIALGRLWTIQLDPLAYVTTLGVPGATDVVLSGTLAYVATDGQGIVVVDVSDPSAPAVVGGAPTAGANPEIMLDGGYLFLADETGGIEVFDLLDPLAPASVASGVLPEGADGIALGDGHLYAKSSTSGGFHVVDVSLPTAPVVLGSTTLRPGRARLAATAGTGRVYALFAEGPLQEGMEIVDVSVPTAPVPLGSAYTPLVNPFDGQPAEALAFAGAYVLLASGSGVYPNYNVGTVYTYPVACAAAAVAAPLPASRADLQLSVEPNPFTGKTVVRYTLPRPEPVRVGVFDVRGRRVRELPVATGDTRTGAATWDGTDAGGSSVAPGVYFVRLRAGNETRTVRTVRLR